MLHAGINGRSIFRQMTGVQHYAREVINALLALQAEDVRFTVFSGREGRRQAEPGMPVDASFFPSDGPARGLVWEQTLLRGMARKAKIDVLFNPGNVAPLNPPVPSVVTIHDLAFLLFPEYFSRSFALYYRTVVPRIATQAAIVITDSQSTREGLEEHLGIHPDRIRVIPLGVSTSFRRRLSAAQLQEVRTRYRLPEHFFLSVSSLEPRKNLSGILGAYRLLPEEITDEHKLVVIGAGNRVFADPGLVKDLSRVRPGTVHSPGYVPDDDLPAIYRMATALVFPSFYEGFGLPVLEAMTAATPVITSNRSSLPEVAGHAGVLIDPDSVEELAAAMELVAADTGTRNLLIERGKKRAAMFTWEKTAQLTLDALRDAAPLRGRVG